MAQFSATVTAPVNIATLKYWGKRDVSLNLPTNNSISVTLSQADLKTTTTARASPEFEQDAVILNGKEEPFSKRLQAVFSELKKERKKYEQSSNQATKLSDMHIHVESSNNFPTAAGLASSAAGFAALVKAIATLYQLPLSEEELSVYARQGSGSACRSLMGGYVAWEMGTRSDGLDSKAVQIASASHWPDMHALILVASDKKKDTSSTAGMQHTVQTSTLFEQRIKHVVPDRFEKMKKAILDKNFEEFATLTMQDSNQFHATCLDTYPPIFYMNDTSRAAVQAVQYINATAGRTVAAYTFDAGPNAVIYYQAQDAAAVLGPIHAALPSTEGWKQNLVSSLNVKLSEDDINRWGSTLQQGTSRVIQTSVGEGPQVLETTN